MLCADIMRQAGKISDAEWSFFLRGAAGVEKVKGWLGGGGTVGVEKIRGREVGQERMENIMGGVRGPHSSPFLSSEITPSPHLPRNTLQSRTCPG